MRARSAWAMRARAAAMVSLISRRFWTISAASSGCPDTGAGPSAFNSRLSASTSACASTESRLASVAIWSSCLAKAACCAGVYGRPRT
ncbi:MAG: hypothetical protein MUD06_13395 [Rhodospirillales bacterium]|nr:hypothetical protein [Rhodospirillales bacterium]